eukprot:6478141-Prymnesium_polylepis.1
MVAVDVTPGARTASARVMSLSGTARTRCAPRGTQIATTGHDCGLSLAMGTWMVNYMLRSLPFRQESAA